VKRRDEPEPPGQSLRHNPFAVLKQDGSAPRSSLEPAPQRVSEPARSEPGTPNGIVVRREKKGRGGKGVKIAEGAGLARADLAALAREAARALGTGARVEAGTLVVQGEQVERVIALLTSHGLGPIVRGN
jgi:translation initiation factor 1